MSTRLYRRHLQQLAYIILIVLQLFRGIIEKLKIKIKKFESFMKIVRTFCFIRMLLQRYPLNTGKSY